MHARQPHLTWGVALSRSLQPLCVVAVPDFSPQAPAERHAFSKPAGLHLALKDSAGGGAGTCQDCTVDSAQAPEVDKNGQQSQRQSPAQCKLCVPAAHHVCLRHGHDDKALCTPPPGVRRYQHNDDSPFRPQFLSPPQKQLTMGCEETQPPRDLCKSCIHGVPAFVSGMDCSQTVSVS